MILNIDATRSEAPCIWKNLITGLVLAALMAALTLGANLGVAYASDHDNATSVPPAQRVAAQQPPPPTISSVVRAHSDDPSKAAALVTWQLEEGAESYVVRYRHTDSHTDPVLYNSLQSEDSDANTSSHKITGMNLDTEYYVFVHSATAEGVVNPTHAQSVIHTNRAPAFGAAPSLSVAEDAAAGANIGNPVTATDADSDTLSYSISDDSGNFVIASATGQISVAGSPSLTQGDSHEVTVTAEDTYGAQATITVTITVNEPVTPQPLTTPKPSAPDAPTVSRSSTESSVQTGGLLVSWNKPEANGTIIERYELQYREQGTASWTDITQIVSAKPLPTFGIGKDTYSLYDGTTYEVRVRAVARHSQNKVESDWSDAGSGTTNTPPSFGNAPALEVREDAAAGANIGNPVTPTDSDGDNFTYELADDSKNFAINAGTGQIHVAHSGSSLDHDAKPIQTVTVIARDGHGGKDTVEVPIWVTKREPRSIKEYAPGGTSVGSPVRSGSATYTLSGVNSSHFVIANNGQLRVAQGATLDYGTYPEYDLKVEFPYGNRTARFFVTITLEDVVPDAPGAPVAERNPANPDRSIKVTWTAPADNGEPITGYTVRYSGGGSQGEQPFLASSTQGIVTGLSPTTSYTVQVKADANGEDSFWSPSSNAVTTKGPPTLAEPQDGSGHVNREVYENSPPGTAVGSPLSFADPDGDSLTFKIGAEDGTPEGWFTIDPATGQIRVGAPAALDFEASGSYGVSVSVSDNDPDAAADLSQTVIITLLDEPQLPPPPGLAVATYSATSLKASWNEPAAQYPAQVTGYDVQYRLAGSGPQWTDYEFSGTGRDAIIRDLTPGTLYHVRVRAASGEELGEWSDYQQARTRSKDSDGAQIITETRVVAENAAPGTLLGAPVQATDPLDHALQYVMSTGQDRFRVDPDSGQITVAEGADLDYETRTSHTVEIEAWHREEVQGVQHIVIDAIITVEVQVTDVDEVPLRPTGLVMTPGTTTMRVTWEPPAPNGSPPVNDYRAVYWVETVNISQNLGRLGNVTEVVITGLKPATHYGFAVTAINDEGESRGAWAWKTTRPAALGVTTSDPTLSALSLTDSDGMDVTLTADVTAHWNTLNCSERNDRVGAADQPDDETSPYCRMYDELDAEAKAVVDQTYADDPIEGFASDINMYYATVASSVDMVTVSATAGAGADGVTGDVGDVSLDVGENTITVTAENGSTTKDYTGMVTRETDEERLLRAYDTNGNGSIDPEELSDAIIDYLDGTLSPSDMSILIVLYLG